MITLKNVIQKMFKSPNSPSHKAHANMALRKYSERRAKEIGSTPKRVVAGVRAAFTKRKREADGRKTELFMMAKRGEPRPTTSNRRQ